MRITYDPSVDAAYIYFKEDGAQVTTVRLTEDIAVDLGPHEEIYGIEILDAAQHMGFKPDAPSIRLENITAAQ